MREYVIIGGGVAAVSCIEGIRSVDGEGRITLISGEGRAPYCRPLISYCLQGKTDLEKMKFRPDRFYTENNCRLLFERAAAIDPGTRTVLLEGGGRVAYDALCAATGAAPSAPDIPGLDCVDKRFFFTAEDDALALEKSVGPDSDVLILGAGLIGLKCAECLADRAASVTVCNRSSQILTRVLDADSAALMQKRLEENGVGFILGDGPERLEGQKAILKSGREIPFDVLVLALGTRPETALISSAGGACGQGVLVDNAMRASLDGVFAAGDCAQGFDASAGERRVIATAPNACMQGRCAGINMAGGHETLNNSIPMNAVGFFGLHALTAGSYTGDMLEAKAGTGLKRLFISGGQLRGFILIGDVTGAGIYTAMIRNRTPLDAIDTDDVKKAPSLGLFPEDYRRKVLGGVV